MIGLPQHIRNGWKYWVFGRKDRFYFVMFFLNLPRDFFLADWEVKDAVDSLSPKRSHTKGFFSVIIRKVFYDWYHKIVYPIASLFK